MQAPSPPTDAPPPPLPTSPSAASLSLPADAGVPGGGGRSSSRASSEYPSTSPSQASLPSLPSPQHSCQSHAHSPPLPPDPPATTAFPERKSSHTRRTSAATTTTVGGGYEEPNGTGNGVGGVGGTPFPGDVVPATFDESILRALCDMDCGMPLLLDRIKQSMVSCREASIFLKKRAAIEDEYGRNMLKLAKSTSEIYAMNDGRAGTFVSSWHSMMRVHESLGEGRIRFGARLGEMSEELAQLAKEVDKGRKQAKDLGQKYEKNLQDAEMSMEKAKHRFDATAEELERVLIIKEGETVKESSISGGAGGKGLSRVKKGAGGLFRGKNPAQILKQEEEIRNRTSQASDAFRKTVQETQQLRSEYFNLQLPRILRTLKECADEIDLGTQYHLERYAFLYENSLLSEGVTITPLSKEDGPGFRQLVEEIDNQRDFKTYMQNYAVAQPRATPRREGPWDEGVLSTNHYASPAAVPRAAQSASLRPTFGVDLTEQMIRDDVEIPPVVEKCVEVIEAYGLESQGIYRLSGTTSKVQRLKARLDHNVDSVDLMSEEESGDINIVSSLLKLWFRELPEPLLTYHLYSNFTEAAKIENDRLRHIRLHETVNNLPDANYATLKYFMGHLDKVKQLEDVNSMSASNLAIVFGPTLLSPPPGGTDALADMQYQCRAVETILEHYAAIFVEEEEA